MKGGSMHRTATINGDESDVVGRGRAIYCWTQRPGATAKVKRRIRRRERQQAKTEMRDYDQEVTP